MKTATNLLIFFLPLFFTYHSLYALSWDESPFKNSQELQKKLLEKQKRMSEKLKKSFKLKAELFDNLEEKLESFMDGVGKKFFDGFFEDEFFKDDFFKDDFFKGMDSLGKGRRATLGQWRENGQEMIFILNLEAKKGVPLNIEIKNGTIKVAGDVIQKNEKIDQKGNKRITSQRLMRIRQSYSIPDGLDEKNPLIQEEKGKIKIIFKKLKGFKSKKKGPSKNKPQNLKPINPSLFDKTI